jgi:hypothetical protein
MSAPPEMNDAQSDSGGLLFAVFLLPGGRRRRGKKPLGCNQSLGRKATHDLKMLMPRVPRASGLKRSVSFTACIHGHILGYSYAGVFPDHQMITMVRNPVERVVSNYYHFIHHPDFRHPASIQLHANRLTLREFAEIGCMRNEATRYVAGRDPNDFDFVGITEHFEASVRLFTQLLGLKRELPVSRVNINPERSTPAYPISPEDRSHLLELNRADVAWYDRACEVFAQTFIAQFGAYSIPDAAVMNFLAAEEKDRVAVA